MNRYGSYFYYWISAQKRHNIHSPFVYDLSDKCLSLTVKSSDKLIISKQFELLSNNKNCIEISDFGAGSKKMGKTRRISDIFKNSRSSERYATLLYQLSAYYKPQRILEFGTSLAWGTLHLHLGNPEALIDTVEGCPQTFNKSQTLFPVESPQVCFHNAIFEDFIEKLNEEVYDLIFIDGNHRGEALLKYVELLFPYSNSDTIWILDDIRWSDDMWTTWQQISKDARFHVSIDYLRMGILVRRESQEKEAFVLR